MVVSSGLTVTPVIVTELKRPAGFMVTVYVSGTTPTTEKKPFSSVLVEYVADGATARTATLGIGCPSDPMTVPERFPVVVSASAGKATEAKRTIASAIPMMPRRERPMA